MPKQVRYKCNKYGEMGFFILKKSVDDEKNYLFYAKFAKNIIVILRKRYIFAF